MKIIERNLFPRFSHESFPINHQYSWENTLTTDVTEDFIFVEKQDDGYRINLKLFVARNNDVAEITLYFLKCGDEIRLPLTKFCFTNQDIWTVSLTMETVAMLSPFSYRFKISANNRCFFLDAQGIYKYKVNNNTNFKYFYNSPVPEWLGSAIIYHIFIDRFKKSSPSTDREVPWGRLPSGSVQEFYGGDLGGIIERLDYLVSLGVNTICLTPIFKASTNHRYDVEDYYQVDDNLGGNKAFELLCAACRKKNIRIILDGVFNHVSGKSQWFNKDALHGADGAYQSKNSAYFNYFNFHEYPGDYDSFWGDQYLPKLNYHSADLRRVLYKNTDSIVKYWISEPYAVSGWRLDACCMLGKYNHSDINSEILSELYAEVKGTAKNCYIFGENPFDPSEVSQYIHMDGITNYSGFYTPVISWLDNAIDFDVTDLDLALREFRALIGSQFTKSCKTFFGNHDKKRLYGALNGDQAKYFTALTLLFTYPGVPSLYYGEEIGLHDTAAVNDSRICMQWDGLNSIHKETLLFTKNLISLFKSSKAIQIGSFVTLYAEKNVYIYERFIGNELIFVILNNSTKIIDSFIVESNSISRLQISNFHSCFNPSLKIGVFMDRFLEIKNIQSKDPIVICSYEFTDFK